MLVKLTKAMNIVYIVCGALIIVGACTYMTKYNFFPKTLSDVKDTFNATNNNILFLGIATIVGIAILNVVGNGYRKKLYKSNLIVGIAVPAVSAIYGVIVIVQILNCLSLFAENYDTLAKYDQIYNTTNAYTYDNMGMVYVLIIIIVAVLYMIAYIVYTILKYRATNARIENNEKVVA